MLKQRILTAMILIPLTLLLLFFLPSTAFLILTAIITLWGAWEWSHLMKMKHFSQRFLYLLIMAVALFNALFIPVLLIFVCAFIGWLFAAILIIFYPRGSKWWSKSLFWRGLMGLCVLLPCWIALNFIRQASDDNGFYILLFLFVLIWGADSAAYFTGKKWGKTKLAPLVSPGKSVQGVCGAFIFSLLITIAALSLCQFPLSVWLFGIGVSLLTVLFSIVGDLFESMLKRQAGVKDSGQLLPGHGGLLDRIDSLTAAAPVFALGAILLGMNLH